MSAPSHSPSASEAAPLPERELDAQRVAAHEERGVEQVPGVDVVPPEVHARSDAPVAVAATTMADPVAPATSSEMRGATHAPAALEPASKGPATDAPASTMRLREAPRSGSAAALKQEAPLPSAAPEQETELPAAAPEQDASLPSPSVAPEQDASLPSPSAAPEQEAPLPPAAPQQEVFTLRIPIDGPFKVRKDTLLREFERAYFTRLLERCEGNVARSAREAGLDRKHLYSILYRHGLL